ncbi:hypothetical protein GCM10029978_119540 [Actinoallomurus acanthiterrae]
MQSNCCCVLLVQLRIAKVNIQRLRILISTYRHESVGAAVSTGLLPWVLAQWGMQATLLLLAAVLLVGFVVTWLWAPETKALPLVAAGNVGGANEHSVSV